MSRPRRRITALLSGLLLVAGFAGVAHAAHHVTGTWVLTVDLGGQGGTATFELAESDGTVTGTYSGTLGDAEVTGTVEGNAIEFSFDSQAGKITYQGTIDGTSMSGTCTYGQLGEGTFEGEKQTGEGD